MREVAITAQFPAGTIGLESFGAFADAVSESLPRRQQHPPVPAAEETFDRIPNPVPLQIKLEPATTLPRFWFFRDDQAELVQLQHDRLTLNWRQVREEDEYPRYGKLRVRFAELLAILTASVEKGGGQAAAKQCEVTYVNPIEVPGVGSRTTPPFVHPDLAQIINRLQAAPSGSFLAQAEDMQLVARWRIPGTEFEAGPTPVGRLQLAVSPGIKQPAFTPIYVVNLTARVSPPGPGTDAVLKALDVAHKWVVLGFTDLTTPTMHKHWGLKEATSS